MYILMRISDNFPCILCTFKTKPTEQELTKFMLGLFYPETASNCAKKLLEDGIYTYNENRYYDCYHLIFHNQCVCCGSSIQNE